MKVLNFQECVGSTSSTQSASKLAFYHSKLLFTSFFESFRCSAFYFSLHLSILRHVLVNFYSFIPSSPFFFFGSTTSFIFSISCCPLFSITWEKKIQTLWRDTKWKIWERKKKNAKSNRKTRKKKEVQPFFLKFFLLLWFEPWKPWTVFRPGRFNRGLNGFMLCMYRTVFWV